MWRSERVLTDCTRGAGSETKKIMRKMVKKNRKSKMRRTNQRKKVW